MRSRIEFTLTARQHAERQGVLSAALEVVLPPNLARGDIVTLSAATGSATFVMLRRHLHVMADGTQTLVVELDYPVR